MKKQLQDSDSAYCVSNDCTSSQTAFFLGQYSDAETDSCFQALFGASYADNDEVVLTLTKRNLICNLVCHFVSGLAYYVRKANHADPARPWVLDKQWLLSKIEAIEQAMSCEKCSFKVAIHKEANGQKRVYLKGLKNMPALSGEAVLNDLQELIFSQDKIVLNRGDDAVNLWVENVDSLLQGKIERWFAKTAKSPTEIGLPEQVPCDIKKLLENLKDARSSTGLTYTDELCARFVSATVAKPFVVLTGLAGSGKTKLAQMFVNWISASFAMPGYDLHVGLEIKDGAYKIVEADRVAYKVWIASTGRHRTLPRTIVNQWIDFYKAHPEVWSKDSMEVKDMIKVLPGPDDNYTHASDGILANIAKDPAIVQMQGGQSCQLVMSRLVPVGADWTNSEHLLGYPNALESGKYVMPETGVLKLMLDARDNPNLPFFLILDEMNLSHVERYFADFLSAMESGEDIKLHGAKGDLEGSDGTKVPPTIKFPKNLFVIGTMNVDETTYMFSPKVLDRAQVIEFRVGKDEMAEFLANPTTPNLEAIAGKGAKYAEAFLRLKTNPPPLDENGSANKDAITAALTKFFKPLAGLGAEFGYRTASEVVRFCRYYLATGADITDAIDAAIVQKLLPKLHGSQQRLGQVLKKLKELSEKSISVMEDGEQKTKRVPLYKLTWEKLERMRVRLGANGFTSFAEA